MANTYTKYETDAAAEAEGVWVEIDDEVRVKVAAFGNPRHDKALRRLRKPYRNILRTGGDLPANVQDKITVEAMAEGIVIDWEGVTDREGNPLECTEANRLTVLKDLKSLRDKIAWLSMEQETFNKAALEAAKGNSQNASGGSSTGGKKPSASPKS